MTGKGKGSAVLKRLFLPFPLLSEVEKMKAKYSFEMMDLDDGLVAVPVGNGAENFHGVLRVNETAAAVLKLLKQETTEEQIVDSLKQEYSGNQTEITAYVHEFIRKLIEEGIVE